MMKAELLNEFYLMQQSRSNAKYLDMLEEKIYSPLQKANDKVTTWVYKRGSMLMTLERKAQLRLNKIRKKFLPR